MKNEEVFLPLGPLAIEKDVIKKLPPKFASHYKVMPIAFKDGVLTVAMRDPLNVEIIDEISLAVDVPIHPVSASEKDILETIRKYYGVGAETIEHMMGTVRSIQKREEIEQIDEIDSEASIAKFLNQILFEAYRDRSTDIHIEPFENVLHIRYRIDGLLYDAKVPQNIWHFKDSINSRIKILSNLNIAEKRIPQDGRFKVRIQEVELDLRVSFLPTLYGESVVIRLLNTTRLLSLEELGLQTKDIHFLEQLIKKPHGIIFLTGPTGSGKTTTLYSGLSRINTEHTKIITIEDPIEYQLKGITQIQINPKVGVTFANGLRSMLRHDPDMMMVGEVRDKETAEIAIQVALTGHLIFSTLHTNDAASGITRLLDMGVEPYLITSTVECFIDQRLIRKICPDCKESKEVNGAVTYYGKGCGHCHMTGYKEREGIYEFLLMTEEIRQLIMQRQTASVIKEKAVAQGMKTLSEAGWEKVKAGITTPEEILRVTKEEAS